MKKISLFAAISALVGVFATTAFSAVAADAPVISSIAVMSAGLSSPIRGAVDPSGGIAITDPRSGGIVRYSASGKLTQVVAVAGSPQGVASTADGRLLVSMGDSVGVFSSAGLKIGSLGAGVGQFKMANGIALDAAGTIYVTDSIDNSVQVFQPDGSFSFRFGSTGTGSGQFFMPTGIAYEKASGQIAVVDTNNGRIQFFSTGGSFQKSIGALGSGPLKFISPQGVAFEYSATGELVRTYILDSYQGNIQALDATGAFLGYVGEYGTKPGQLFVPSDLLFDQAAHRLVVVNGLGNLTTYALAAPGPVDTTPPTLALVDFEPVISETSYLLKGTVEAGATVSIFLGNAQVGGAAKVTGSSWSYTVSGLSVGANSIRISALDAARNEASSTVTLTVNPPNIYTITATAAAGGTITPTATLNSGQSKKFVITPAAGFHIADVVVDGESKGAIKSYTFSKVSDNHSISAIFSNVYTITAAVTSGLGTIDPKTPAVLHQGDDVVLTFTPAAGWHVAKVVVDGSTKPAKTTYALKNLAADHQVAVAFEKNTYKIVAQKSGRGTVTPASTVALHGSTLPIAIVPGVGYHVKDVLVDGVSVGDVTSYSFENIDRAHTLKATFAINTYTLTSAAYPAQGGSITVGSVARYGTAKTFTIKPKSGYKIADVKVDGVSIGVKTSYRVGPLTGDRAKDYAIEAYFASTAPLTVSALADGRSAAGRVQNVTGRVSGPSATVTVNGSKAPVIDGIYSAPVILTPGTNTVTITESSAGSDPVTGTRVLVLPPAMPALSVDSPADGTRTDTPVITLSGAVDTGCQVSVAGVPASVSGTRWTATMSLVPGFNTLEVIATDPAGFTSAVKRTVILDTTLPAVAIISPVEDFVTNAAEVIVTGFAGAASGVTVSATVNGIPAAVEVVDGTFTVRVATPEERTYVVAVTAADPSGKAATAVRTIIRNATAPRLTLLPPKPGATVLTGSVDSGAVVIIRDANGVVGQAAVTENTWRLDLADKIYDFATLAVTATDAAGNVTELRL